MYIHYGHDQFDKNKFEPIKNRPEITKPKGGLWASREDSNSGWRNWCENNEYKIDTNKYFKFRLKDNAKILTLTDKAQLYDLPKAKSILPIETFTMIDFEKLSEEYDAIEVFISSGKGLYFALYGWDCDSIVIMNPDIIIPE